MKDQHSSIRMHDFFNIHPESDSLKQLLRHCNGIIKSLRTHYRAGRFIGNAKQQQSTPFIGKRNAVFMKLAIIELCLGLLEFQTLVFGALATP